MESFSKRAHDSRDSGRGTGEIFGLSLGGSVVEMGVAAQDMFIFRVEGTGVLKVEDVVMKALDRLVTKLRNLQEALPQQDDGAA